MKRAALLLCGLLLGSTTRGEEIVRAERISRADLEWPTVAGRREGWVRLGWEIDENGRPDAIEVLDSNGLWVYENAARRWVASTRYRAARRGGEAVRQRHESELVLFPFDRTPRSERIERLLRRADRALDDRDLAAAQRLVLRLERHNKIGVAERGLAALRRARLAAARSDAATEAAAIEEALEFAVYGLGDVPLEIPLERRLRLALDAHRTREALASRLRLQQALLPAPVPAHLADELSDQIEAIEDGTPYRIPIRLVASAPPETGTGRWSLEPPRGTAEFRSTGGIDTLLLDCGTTRLRLDAPEEVALVFEADDCRLRLLGEGGAEGELIVAPRPGVRLRPARR